MERLFEESWFYAPVYDVGDEVQLSTDEATHIKKVLRLQHGTSVVVSNGSGGVFFCDLAFSKDEANVIAKAIKCQQPNPPRLNLILSLLKGKDLEEAAEGICQINVNTIHLVTTDHTLEFKGQNHTRLVERLRSKSLVGLKQAKKPWLTKINEPISFEVWHKKFSTMPMILLHPGIDRLPKTMEGQFGVLTGPEGGFSKAELKRLEAQSCFRLGLGDTRIRSIHAPLLACGKLLGHGWI
jgi:16S rRNA (uracil1498-N3)-methyltransferase